MQGFVMFCSLLFAKLDKIWSAWRINMRVSKLRNLYDPGTWDSSPSKTSKTQTRFEENGRWTYLCFQDSVLLAYHVLPMCVWANVVYVAIFNSVFTSIPERRGPSISGPSTGRSLWRADPQRFATCEGHHAETFETFWNTSHRVANLIESVDLVSPCQPSESWIFPVCQWQW